ncbi:hypothetical protein RRG08_022701 [Elysia crispata]|uniref:Uncharacterized protein n=1 Tax=Elysia crispata TaxID=231223 RepID=A0AAE0ZF84_9GAST|nr:hypothetical protein RRG08_022701 [Elysia crispata]
MQLEQTEKNTVSILKKKSPDNLVFKQKQKRQSQSNIESSRHQDAASLCPGLYCLTFHSLSSSHRDTKTLLPSVLVYIA